jgi:hypothetical protein
MLHGMHLYRPLTRPARAPGAPTRGSASPTLAMRVLALQRSAGNAAVTRLLQRDKAAPDVGSVDLAGIIEDYPISPGDHNSLKRNVYRRDTSVGDVASSETVDTGHRTLTKDGLRDYLTTRQNGHLSDFDKQLISAWGKDPAIQLTAVLRMGDNRIFAYMVDSGGSGDRVRTVHAADGTVVAERHSERPLVNMGLGPIDWVLLASAAVALGRAALRYAAAKAAAAEAAAAGGAIRLAENQVVFAVIQDGRIIAKTFNNQLSHAEFLQRTTGWTKETLPAGVEVVTIGKEGGDIFAILSQGIHGRALPASYAALAAARAAFH